MSPSIKRPETPYCRATTFLRSALNKPATTNRVHPSQSRLHIPIDQFTNDTSSKHVTIRFHHRLQTGQFPTTAKPQPHNQDGRLHARPHSASPLLRRHPARSPVQAQGLAHDWLRRRCARASLRAAGAADEEDEGGWLVLNKVSSALLRRPLRNRINSDAGLRSSSCRRRSTERIWSPDCVPSTATETM